MFRIIERTTLGAFVNSRSFDLSLAQRFVRCLGADGVSLRLWWLRRTPGTPKSQGKGAQMNDKTLATTRIGQGER